jgi:hypothetical protein
MDVVIQPFWIGLSVVYFWLAAIHHKLQFVISPSSYQAAAYTPSNDPYVPMIFRRILRDIDQNRKLMRYASYGFFAAGVASLLQGIINLEFQIVLNVAFFVLGAIIVFIVIYWRWKWVILVFVGPIQRYRSKRKHNS